MKNYVLWLKIAAISQFITTTIHTISLFVPLVPSNDTEKQLISLVNTYQFDFGAGFHRTISDLMLVLNACYSLICLMGGLIIWHLLRKKVVPEILRGVININLVIFGICFVLVAIFTFLVPIVLTGLILLFLIVPRSIIMINRTKKNTFS